MRQDSEIARLRWQCRRSMLELDLLLERFLADCYSKLSEKQRGRFVELLQTPDPELFAWVSDHCRPEDPDFRELVTLIREGCAASEKPTAER